MLKNIFKKTAIEQPEIEAIIMLKFINKFKKNLSEISPKNILEFVIYLMQKVDKYEITGETKKEVVLSLIKKIISTYKDSIKNMNHIEKFINIISPSLIDIIISLDKKEMYIKIKNECKNCMCV